MKPNDGQSLPSSTPPRKRRRKQLVCSNCRDRKIRCDGQRPICSSCVSKRLERICVYEKSYLRAQSHVHHEFTEASRSYSRSQAQPPSSSSQSSIQSTSTNISLTRSPGGLDTQVILSSTKRNAPLYGGSSTDALVSQVQQATTKVSTSEKSANSIATSGGPGSHTYAGSTEDGVEIIHDQDFAVFSLPQRQAADSFLGCYWEFLHPVFPILHKYAFIAQYESIWAPADTVRFANQLDETIFHATLYLVFALGCQFSSFIDPSKRSGYANEFYQQSRKVVNFEIFDSMQLSLVQLLLLTSVYLQSTTQNATRCWNMVGLAIRVAQGLGMHFNEVTATPESQSESEIRRRVWYSCVLLDRLLAMTSGRPTMLSGSWDVKLPTVIDDEYLLQEGEGVQPPSVLSRMNLFVYSLHLFDIMDEILSTFYLHDSGRSVTREQCSGPRRRVNLGKILEINLKLDKFRDTIPEALRPESISNLGSEPWFDHHRLQSKILNSRFLYVRILLLRPVLLAVTGECANLELSANRDTQLEHDLEAGACKLCVRSTQLLLENLYDCLDTTFHSPGWHTVYFAFAAGTILIAAYICQLVPTDHQSFEASWTKCIAILQHHTSQIQSSKRAIETLMTLKQRIERSNVVRPIEMGQDDASSIQNQRTNRSRSYDASDSNENKEELNHAGANALSPSKETTNRSPDVEHFGLWNLEFGSMDSMDNIWFTQQLLDLDWMNFSQG